jgi:aspartyl aminopeptidase
MGIKGRRKILFYQVAATLGELRHPTEVQCRNQAALLAFTLPQKWKEGAGVSIVATHVDSPNLKVRNSAL